MVFKPSFGISILVFAAILLTKVYGQNLEFVNTFNSPGADGPSQTVLSGAGNLFVTGYFDNDSIVIGNMTLHSPVQNKINTFIAKLDTAGQCYWAQVIFYDSVYNNPAAIAVDSNENVYVSSFFSEETDIDPGSGIQNLVPVAGYRSMFLAKYDANGTFNWAFQVTDSMSFPNSVFVEVDKNQDVILTGTFSSFTDFDPSPVNSFYLQASTEVIREPFVAKYTPSGQFIYAFRLVEQNYGMAEIFDLTTDSQNNIILTGYIVESVDMDPDPVATHLLTTNGSWDYFLAKYTPQGDLLWAFNVGSWTNEAGNFVVTDENDSIFVGGIMRSPATDFDHSPTNTVLLTTHGETDIFLAKYSPNGDLAFINNIGGSNIELLTAMGKDPFNHLYWVISYWSNNWDSDFSNSVNTINAIGAGDDLIMRTNSDGNVDFAFTIGTVYTDNYTQSIVPIDNGFFLYGWYNGNTVDFDPSSGFVSPQFFGASDITLAKYYYKWDQHVGLNELSNTGNEVIVYPNPVTGDLLNIHHLPENAWISLYDANGNLLISEETGKDYVLLGMRSLSPGLYLLKIDHQEHLSSFRLVVE